MYYLLASEDVPWQALSDLCVDEVMDFNIFLIVIAVARGVLSLRQFTSQMGPAVRSVWSILSNYPS